jgi:hypothetical protein
VTETGNCHFHGLYKRGNQAGDGNGKPAGTEKRGKLEIEYYSKDELDRLVELLGSAR